MDNYSVGDGGGRAELWGKPLITTVKWHSTEIGGGVHLHSVLVKDLMKDTDQTDYLVKYTEQADLMNAIWA